MRTAFAIARRELRTAFDLPVAYVFMAAFLALGALFGLLGFFDRGVADLRDYFSGLRYAFVLFAPAVAMRLWAEERRSGTYELLFTLPVRPWEAVLGKFLGAMGLVVASLALGAALPLTLSKWATFDVGALVAGYAGVLLLASVQVALGLLASALTENQIVAFVSAAAGSLFLLVLGEPAVLSEAERLGLPARLLAKIGTGEHQESLARGILDSRDLVYFVALAAALLIANVVAVERRGRRLEAFASVVLALAVFVLAEDVASRRRVRADLTSARSFSLAEGTRRLLAQADQRLTLRCYLSRDLPAAEEPYRRQLLDLLRELEARGGKNVRLEIVDPQGDEKLVERAKREGITRIPRTIKTGDATEERPIWCGLVVLYGGKPPVPIPYALYRQNLEYDLAVVVKRLVAREPQRIAWIEDKPQRGPASFSLVKQELARSYTVEPLDQRQALEVDARFQVVVAVLDGATILDKRACYVLDQFVARGGALVLLIDGQHAAMDAWTSTPIAVHEDILDALEKWGIHVAPELGVVPSNGLYTLASRVRGEPVTTAYPYFLRVSGDTGPGSPIAQGLRDSLFLWASEVTPVTSRLAPEARVVPLVTTRPGWSLGGLLVIDPALPIQTPRAPGGGFVPARPLTIATAIAGPIAPAFDGAVPLVHEKQRTMADPLAVMKPRSADAHLVVFGDTEFAHDQIVRSFTSNAVLLLEAIDWATQDTSLSTLRARSGPPRVDEHADRGLAWGVNLLAMPGLVILVGVARFWIRRRRAARAARAGRGGAA